MAEINQIISKDAIATIDRIEKLLKLSAEQLDKVIQKSKDLNTALNGVKGDKLKELNKLQKEARDNALALADEQKKIVKIREGVAKSTDKVVRAQIESNKTKKEQRDRIKETLVLESKEAGTLEKLAAKNRILYKEKTKLNLQSEQGRKRLKEINKELDKNQKFITKTGDATQKQAKNIGNYSSALTGLKSPIGGAIASVQAFGKSLLVLLANPVVLIIAAIAAAFALMAKAMTRSESGQDRLNKIWRVTASVLDNIMDIATAFGVAIFDTLPKGFQLLGETFNIAILRIQKGFLNARIAALEFFGADEKADKLTTELNKVSEELETSRVNANNLAKEIADGFSGAIEKAKNLGAEIEADAAAAQRLADLEAQFNKDERKAIVQNAKLAKDSAKLRGESEALKKVEAEQAMAILEESFKLDEKVLANELRLANQRVNILKTQSSLASDTIEDKKAIAEAEAAVYGIEQKFNELRRQRIRRLNILRLEAFKQENDRRKVDLDAAKLAAQEVVKVNDDIVDSELQNIEIREAAAESTRDAKVKLADEEYSIAKAQLDKEKELKLKNEEDYLGELALLDAKRVAAGKAVNEEYLDSIRVIYESSSAAYIANVENQATNELLILKQALADGAITRQQFSDEVESIEYNKAQAITQFTIDALQKTLDEVELSAEERLLIEQELAERLGEIKDAELDKTLANIEEEKAARAELKDQAIAVGMEAIDTIAQLYTDGLERQRTELETQKEAELALAEGNKEEQDKINAKYAKKEAELKTKQAKAEKAAAITKAVINTALAISAAAATTPFIPLGLIAVGLAAALGAFQIAKIASSPIPKFAKGTDRTPDTFIAGERGRELMITPSGGIGMVDRPTLFSGLSGAQIFSNKETEAIMANSNTGYDSGEVRDAILRSNKKVVKAIKDNRPILNAGKKDITLREGGYYKTYFNYRLGI